MVRHIGITQHSIERAEEAIQSGLYETMQFPLCMISSNRDLQLAELCLENNVGLIAMKALSGGLLTNIKAAYAFLRQYENIVPIWGIQRMSELEDFLALEAEDPKLDDELQKVIDQERAELCGEFCRACGYCLPCPVDIPIPMAARMHLLVKRMPSAQFAGDVWKEKMERVENCINCGHCSERCPYGLNPPELLQRALAGYREFLGA